MQAGEVLERLRGWEAELPVDEWRIGGMRVWPVVRNEIALRLLASGESWERRRGASAFARARWALGSLGRRSEIAPRRADALFLTHPGNREWLGGAAFDRLFDPLAEAAEELGRSSLQVEYAPAGVARKAPRARPALDITGAIARCQVGARLPAGAGRERLEGYARLAGLMPLARLRNRARLVGLIANRFVRLLDAVRPSCVFVTWYYNPVAMGICLAASQRGIPAVEVQHGIMHSHPAYEGWTRVPREGYELVPPRFWCWSEHDARAPAGLGRTLVGGHPWFAWWERPGAHGAAALERSRALAAQGPAVLVTLSWSSGFTEELQRLLREAPAPLVWWIRLHPAMMAERAGIAAWCAAHGGGRVRVDEPSELPLPLLLRHAAAHLTHFSSVVQEAAAAGVPSVVIDRRALALFPRELESGWARFAEGPAAVAAALREQIAAARSLPRAGAFPGREAMARTLGALLA
jgi:hypothetical protein